MINIKKLLLLVFVFLAIPGLSQVHAAYLKFDKSSSTANNGGTFTIGVQVEPSGDSLYSVDVYVDYDSTLVKATAVSSGSQFPTVSNDISSSGRVYIAGMVNDPLAAVSSTGTLATITFQGLKEGSGNLSFNCDLSKTVKNDINATNSLSCSQNQTSSVTIGSGSSSVQPTTAPSTNNDYVPDELPQSGIWENIAKFAVPGTFLLILGVVLRMALL